MKNPDPSTTGAVLHMADRAVYTVQEVSAMLSISLGGTYGLCRSGEIPAFKLGGRWVVPKKRFHSWLDSLTEEPAHPKGRER